MSKRVKELISSDLERRFARVADAVLVDFSALNAEENRSFRAHLRKSGVSMSVVKNTLLDRVMKQRGIDLPGGAFVGPTGVIHGTSDVIAASKAVVEWRRKAGKKLPLKGGLLEGKPVDRTGAEALASLPGVQELRAMTVSAIAGPLTSTVGVLSSLLSALPRLVQAIADKKPEPNTEECRKVSDVGKGA